MRLAPLAVLALVALPLAAQTPDPTPPEAYYPLGVGDIREYRTSGSFYPPSYARETVLGDTLVSGHTYRLVESRYFDASGDQTNRYRRAVRFDTVQAVPVQLGGDGNEHATFACRLDLPFPTPDANVECEDSIGRVVGGGPEVAVALDSDTLVTAVKSFDGLFGGITFAAGLGELWSVGDATDRITELRYARIAGVEYGEPLDFSADPNPPEAYYPLGIGDVREYRASGGATPPAYLRERVVGDTLAGGQTYRLVVSASYDQSGTETSRARRAVRFDTSLAAPVEREPNGMERQITPCPLDLPFGSDGGEACPFYSGQPDETVTIGDDVIVTAVKGFFTFGGDLRYAAGLGLVELQYEASEVVQRLRYARIGGVEYGEPDPLLPPLGGENGPATPSLALTAGPNPTAGPLMLAVTLPTPAALTIEAFDALGRRVHCAVATLGAGSQTLDVDAGRWAPGLYVVRVATERETATVRVVRR